MPSKKIVEQIIELFQERGEESYGVEAVSQLQHAIQSAQLAKRDGAEYWLVAAALLHDIGHILGHTPLPNSHSQDYDDKHETRAYAWLLENFGNRVADPVRLHVAAKRYLCTIEPNYCQSLSPTSLKSFYDQGGVMNDQEKAAFEQEKYFQEALRLRRWDDEAKDPSAVIPPIDEFATLLESALSISGSTAR